MTLKRHSTALAAILLATTAMAAPAFAASERSITPAWTTADRGSVGVQPASGRAGAVQIAQSRDVREVQTQLNRLGYEAGPEDGLMGSRTRSAIRAYQEDEGLLVTGQPSRSLLNHISDSIEERQEASSTQATNDDAESERIAAIQSELRQRDYRIPVVSGEMNEATREAIRAYERERGYLVTGRATAELLEALQSDDSDDSDNLTTSDIADVQQGLNDRGYDAGPADGVIGPKTRTAIRTYQSDAGMDPTGRVSDELHARLQGDASDDDDITWNEEDDDSDHGEFETLLSDNFDDGNYTSNPRWRIAAGEFSVRNGGLTSRMDASRTDTVQGTGMELLGSVLQRELGIRLPSQGGVDAAQTAVSMSNDFRITAELSGRNFADGQVNIGPYSGNQLGHGYRLAYIEDDEGLLTLLRITSDNQVVLDSTSLSLSNEETVSLDWERQENGLMTVSANGNVLLQAQDNGVSGGFDGFSLINAGGEWTLHNVTVQSRN
ncbi:peptidoglycan-binding domain-containing protein [Fodinicurvata fenggangensis]|uniref:peptidoglycan-binding domain-containing protein n=1 Tax=Fodinicurvata fenggangensis TaxID=1121830 RepID=UPI00047DFE05|nr:peptidoglycan-binding protein [Fodinicurvata fenggangensis]